MELLYIYIKDDGRNIKNCEFNFSPKYRFHYDPSSNTVEKVELDGYIHNFWQAPNIKNITAIVGKNGSGKSNLLECMSLALCGGLDGKICRLIIFEHSGALFSNTEVYSNFELRYERIFSYSPLRQIQVEGTPGIRDSLVMYYSPNIDKKILTNSSTGNFVDISTSNLSREEKKDPDIKYHFPDIEYSQVIDTFRQLLFFMNFNDIYLPEDVTIPAYLEISLFDRGSGFLNPLYQKLSNTDENNSFEKELRNILLKQVLSKKQFESWTEDTPLATVLGAVSSGFSEKQEKYKFSFYDEIMKLYQQGDIKCKIEQHKALKGGNWSDFTFSIRREAIDEKIFTVLIDYYRQVSSFNNATFSSIEYDAHKVINNHCKIKWNGTSSGELAIFTLLSRIFSKLRASQGEIYSHAEHKAYIKNESRYKHIILVLDEPETSLHPEWQRRFMDMMITALKTTFSNYSFQIIITSHSPIIVSDFPNNNIIFLNRNSDGTCKVENSIKENTFGANIYSLYKHSFFVDLPMGEFAKSKIMQISTEIDQLENNECSQKLLNEIMLIGEPIIRNSLLDRYTSKQQSTAKIQVLEKRIEALQQEIKSLRDYNDTN